MGRTSQSAAHSRVPGLSCLLPILFWRPRPACSAGSGRFGAGSALLVAVLAARVLGTRIAANDRRRQGCSNATVPLLAAALFALDPSQVGLSVLVLSEALYTPFLLLALCTLAYVWEAADPTASTSKRPGAWRRGLLALASGACWGATVLIRPSGLLLFPLLAAPCLLRFSKERFRESCVLAASAAIGFALVMSPWWYRNMQTYGKFIPTAAWAGASLYDGLNPRADGSSDMSFLNEPGVWELDELAQDRELSRKAWAFAAEHPRRVVELAFQKACRFWSPVPLGAEVPYIAVKALFAVITIPLYVGMVVGLWSCRNDFRAVVLLAGPLVYFALVHMIFVGSARYRMSASPGAYVLAAIGFETLRRSWFSALRLRGT